MANFARRTVATPRSTMLATIVDDPQMQLIPMLPWKNLFQIGFGLLNTSTTCKLPSLRQTMDVRIDRKRREVKYLRHHHTRGLVSHARQFLEFVERAWNLTGMFFNEHA